MTQTEAYLTVPIVILTVKLLDILYKQYKKIEYKVGRTVKFKNSDTLYVIVEVMPDFSEVKLRYKNKKMGEYSKYVPVNRLERVETEQEKLRFMSKCYSSIVIVSAIGFLGSVLTMAGLIHAPLFGNIFTLSLFVIIGVVSLFSRARVAAKIKT